MGCGEEGSLVAAFAGGVVGAAADESAEGSAGGVSTGTDDASVCVEITGGIMGGLGAIGIEVGSGGTAADSFTINASVTCGWGTKTIELAELSSKTTANRACKASAVSSARGTLKLPFNRLESNGSLRLLLT